MVGTGLIKVLIMSGSTPLLAKLIAMALVLPVNYFSLKIFVYRDR
jgi:putative flippase GtrA